MEALGFSNVASLIRCHDSELYQENNSQLLRGITDPQGIYLKQRSSYVQPEVHTKTTATGDIGGTLA